MERTKVERIDVRGGSPISRNKKKERKKSRFRQKDVHREMSTGMKIVMLDECGGEFKSPRYRARKIFRLNAAGREKKLSTTQLLVPPATR